MNLEIVWTGRFKKDYKKAMKQGLPIEKLDIVIRLLASCVELPKEYKDHLLSGPWSGHRECHILPDWLLIYKVDHGKLVLTLARTGSHSELLE